MAWNRDQEMPPGREGIMKRSGGIVLALSFVFALAAPAAAPAAEAGPRDLASRIARVTVFSDRAQVTRTAAVDLDATPVVYAFRRLPGWVDDGTVRVAVTPSDDGRVVDVRVARDYLARANDAETRRAEAALAEVAGQIAALDDELKVLDGQARQIEAIRAFSAEKIPRDAVVRDVSVAEYRRVIEFVTDSLRSTARARRDVQQRRDALAPDMAACQRRLDELKGLSQLEETTVYVTVLGTRRSDAVLELTYLLPGATWEPGHELRTRGASPESAEIVSFATVTQTSGEDWEGVDIAFATQSSRDSLRIPELEALTLGDTPRTTRTVAAQVSSFSRAQTAFEVQSRSWNMNVQKGNANVRFEEVYDDNVRTFQVVQSRSVQLFRQLQARGTTSHFAGVGRQTVRGDGLPARVVIGRTTLAASPRIVAAPEDSLNAALTLRMTNTGGAAILPGKVALFKDGAFLGMTDADFVAEGEEFSLFVGVADSIKLSRTLDRQASSIVRKTRTRMQVAFLVSVENLGATPATVNLADRVPVSEDRDIRIDQVTLDPEATPDANGLVRWTLTLAPREKRTLRIAYRIEYPPTLVLQTRPEPASPAAAKYPAPMPSDSPRDIRRKIIDLESAF
jgi:uncharacterized protein (TIGR02231 family)